MDLLAFQDHQVIIFIHAFSFEILFHQHSGRDGYTNVKSAFFVALNNTYSLQSDSSVIVWDDILLNKYHHLNNQTGIYHAPINGLYEFSLTVCVPANHIVRPFFFFSFR